MLFDSALFLWFFAAVYLIAWALFERLTARTLWLLGASYLFYGSWNAKYLLLIILSSAIDYALGRKLGQSDDLRVRRTLLWSSVVMNLGMLGVFKYFNFFSSSISASLAALGVEVSTLRLDILLPVGISFYTFQTMSYTIDIYRRELEPVKRPIDFALFVAFFPQLVAGPIVRARDFLPQLLTRPTFLAREHMMGIYLIAGGMFKKVAIANYLSVNLVDRVFETPHVYSSLEVLCGIYGYALQIYCDFSGYSDVAIGAALMLGFRLPENFDRPYQATNLQEFWRRWHISLSTWLRDYLYISLGGNRGGGWRTYRNLALTMVLGGLWHGASWNFVIWGALHGGALAAHRKYREWMRGRPTLDALTRTRWFKGGALVATFHFVCLAWVFFRAQTLPEAMAVLEALGPLSHDAGNISATLWLVLVGALGWHLTPRLWALRLREGFIRLPTALQALLLVTLTIALARVKGIDVVPFIYFQF